MKKYLSLLLTVCLLFMICACSGNETTDTDQAPSSDNVAGTEQVTPAVDYSHITADTLELYISTDARVGPSDSSDDKGSTMLSVVKAKAEDAGLGMYNEKYEMIKKTDMPDKISQEVLSEKYEFTYGNSKIYSNPDNADPFYNRALDGYYWTDGGNKSVSIKILSGTNKILSYRNSVCQDWSEGDPLHDEQELSAMAENCLLSVMTEKEFEKFVPRQVRFPEDFMGQYGLYYDRFVHGYQTDEAAYVIIDQDKKIVSYFLEFYGKFDELEKKFTKAHIDAVAIALQDKIENTVTSEDALISEPKLTTDVNGGLYVAIQIRYPSTMMDETIYAKVG